MRWKTEQKPNTGDTRLTQYYAFLPIDTDDGYTVWLEYYWVEEQFHYFPSEGHGTWLTKKKMVHHPDRPNTGSTLK
jgi:hypothetical protein